MIALCAHMLLARVTSFICEPKSQRDYYLKHILSTEFSYLRCWIYVQKVCNCTFVVAITFAFQHIWLCLKWVGQNFMCTQCYKNRVIVISQVWFHSNNWNSNAWFLQCWCFNMKHHLSHYLLNEVLKSSSGTLKLRTRNIHNTQ